MFWMPNGANPSGMSGSAKLPLTSVDVAGLKPLEPLGANTSTVPALKFVAKRKTPLELVTKTRPLYTAPLPELSTASTAWSAGLRPPAQAESVPSSVSNIKLAAVVVPGTRKPAGLVVGFQTRPVGAAGVGAAGLVGGAAG